MSDDQHDVLRDLRGELEAVAPSAGFAASVRARVGAESTERRGFATWVVPVGVAAAVAIIAGAYVASRPASVAEAPSAQVATVTTTPPSAAPTVQALAPAAATTPPVRRRSNAPRVEAVRAASASEPALQVITNQGDVLRAVWARVRGPVTAEPAAAPGANLTPDIIQEIPVAPILVEPIVVRAIEPSRAGGGVAPVVRRVADDATRSER